MQTVIHGFEGKTIRIERDVMAVSSLHPVEADPAWRYVDRAGHEHRWAQPEDASGGPIGASITSVEYVETERWWCSDCRDEHVETEPRCRQCGQVIQLGYRDAPNPTYITGEMRVWVDDEPLDREAGYALLERLRAAAS